MGGVGTPEGLARAPRRSTFVGRGAELESLDAMLSSARLVTMWGTAGIGKTRLAAEVAARWSARMETVWCDLSRARSVSALCAEVAAAIGAPLEVAGGAEEITSRIADLLRARGQLLLVLDNFEQAITHAEATVGRWLAEADGASFLVTSRERLRVRGEVSLELGPLGLPADGDLETSDAARLFLLRLGERVGAPPTPSGETRARIAALVEKLEGIPLAIELAASRADVLGLDEVMRRLDRRLDLLAGAWRGADRRQATLRGAIAWSWELLSPAEQRALAECSVFRGGFTVAAGEHVLSPADDGTPVLDLLQSLREKSLLRVTGRPDAGEPPQLSAFESVREFAEEALRSLDGFDELVVRHAEHYLALPPAQAGTELDNLLAITERWTASSEPARVRDAIRALLLLEPALASRGPSDLLLELVDRARPHAEAHALDPALCAKLWAARGRVLQLRGRLDEAERDFESAIELARESGERALQAAIVTDVGVLHHQRRQHERARDCYTRAIALERGKVAAPAQARLLANLAALHHDLRDFDAAHERYVEALDLARSAGDARLEGVTLTNLGALEQEQGDLATALRRFERAVELLGGSGQKRFEAIALGNLGALHHERGAFVLARRCHERALAALRPLVDVKSEVLARCRLVAALAATDAVERALREHAEAARIAEAQRDPVALTVVDLARALIELAMAVEAEAGSDPESVARLLESVRERVGRAYADGADGAPGPAAVSDDVRWALRLVARAKARFDAEVAAEPSESALVITVEAKWFRAPHDRFRDLRKHEVLRRVLLALVEQRRVAPGRGLPLEAVQRAAWPGERIRPDAAANRIYVAIAKLRRMGLRDCLVRNEDGYLLEPELSVQRLDALEPPAGALTDAADRDDE